MGAPVSLRSCWIKFGRDEKKRALLSIVGLWAVFLRSKMEKVHEEEEEEDEKDDEMDGMWKPRRQEDSARFLLVKF